MNFNRIRKFILIGLFIVIFGGILLGAINVTLGRNYQIKSTEKAIQKVRSWHGQIALEVPSSQEQSWNNLGNEYPFLLLTACAVEIKATD